MHALLTAVKQVTSLVQLCHENIKNTFTPPDIWYVNVNGKEGWIPSDVLRPLSDDKLNEKFDTNSDSLLPHPTVSLPLHPGSEIVPESEVASLPSHPVSEIASSPPHPIMSAPLSYKGLKIFKSQYSICTEINIINCL